MPFKAAMGINRITENQLLLMSWENAHQGSPIELFDPQGHAQLGADLVQRLDHGHRAPAVHDAPLAHLVHKLLHRVLASPRGVVLAMAVLHLQPLPNQGHGLRLAVAALMTVQDTHGGPAMGEQLLGVKARIVPTRKGLRKFLEVVPGNVCLRHQGLQSWNELRPRQGHPVAHAELFDDLRGRVALQGLLQDLLQQVQSIKVVRRELGGGAAPAPGVDLGLDLDRHDRLRHDVA
mmetsp:Transcript_84537/g.234425  ORF Transcript_84537/g.234425 Transcript_84537/m.234425 type:complete len:234 (+) Transcript_84537:96-797(+)